MFDPMMIIGGVATAIISYFLKRTMDELKEIEHLAHDNKAEIDLLKLDYKNKIENLTEKFDELKTAVSDLTKCIMELNKRIK